ncbi:MAG: recombinase family protein [Symploca sp. SIO2D2]|nr:recombinase family protein [Symploca sp. SIO2D2]
MTNNKHSIWITGSTRSGKTTRLVTQFRQWVEGGLGKSSQVYRLPKDRQQAPAILVFAANDDNRRDLADKLTIAIQGRYPLLAKTPLGFFQDEVSLFWPLLIQELNLRAQFPLRLRPETEQELATKLWRSELEQAHLELLERNEYKRVRRILDLLLLAAVSGTAIEDIPTILREGITELEGTPETWESIGQMLLSWKEWCLTRGLLTYSIIAELYWRYLLPHPTYQQHLQQRYQAVLADDVDDYPAIARDLFDYLLDQGAVGAFGYNPDGQVRLGLNADPNYLAGLASRCQVETLSTPVNSSLAGELGSIIVELVSEPMFLTGLPESVQSLQTTSRAQLLRQTAQAIIEAVKSGQVQPGEIAVIAPGLDAIARYTLTEILTSQGIAVEPLNAQRPLISSPMICALLTLLALVYPGLGRLVDKDAIAQMLVVLSQKSQISADDQETPLPNPSIDPVRAGLLADHCYVPDPEQPRLLAADSFPRWDRLGHRATVAYTEIVEWLEEQRQQQQQRFIPSCVAVLDRAIQKFLWNGSNLPYEQIAALRELMETAQHYWEVDRRLQQSLQQDRGIGRRGDAGTRGRRDEEIGRWGDGEILTNNQQPTTNNKQPTTKNQQQTIANFILMLRHGTVTANPYPVRRSITGAEDAVTLATIFQYRASRRFHRWHFWLDASSHLWEIGGAATLFAAPLFLKEWSGQFWTEEDKTKADEQRLQRILRDLLGRVGERIYLCHSDLAVNGTDQSGPLLTLVSASTDLTQKTP